MQAEEKETPPASTPAASRFAYDVLTNEDDAVKAPNVKRGKDGHVTLGGGADFFADPMGTSTSGVLAGLHAWPCLSTTTACDS